MMYYQKLLQFQNYTSKINMNYSIIKKRFPKSRPQLSKEYLEIYEEHYKNNRDGKGLTNFLSSYMESWAHKVVSKTENKSNKILEIGAGTLNHLKYEKNYDEYDVVEPFKNLFKESSEKIKINKFYESIFEIDNKSYDRIISIMTFEHLENLPEVVGKCSELLNKDGVMQIAIPCEGEFAFKLGWKLTTAISFRIKYGLDYSKIMSYEHLNTQAEIITVIKNFFKINKFVRSPFILPIKNLSFYCFIQCKKL